MKLHPTFPNGKTAQQAIPGGVADIPASVYVATAHGSQPLPGARSTMRAGMTPTGFGSAETSLAVASDGTLFMAPAYSPTGNGVIRSRDRGATWELLRLRLPSGESTPREQPYMYLDPATDRLFVHNSVMRFRPPDFRGGYHQFISDDLGNSFRYQLVAEELRDWSKYCAGPSVTSQTSGYPNVLYLSGPSPISTRFFPVMSPAYQSVRKSLDGGKTWERVGRMSLRPEDVPGLSRWEWVIYGNGVVGPDGSVYWALRRGPRVAVAISRDEGHSWQIEDVPGARLLPFFNLLQIGFGTPNYLVGESLSVDRDGNLYVVWAGHDDRLRMCVSRDGARTFSEPVVISSPEVTHVAFPCASIKEPGVKDAFAPRPVFHGATINPPDEPLYPRGFKVGYDRMIFGGDLNEIVHARYTPEGHVVASFCKKMRRGAHQPSGWDYPEHAHSPLQAVLGRLVTT